MIDSAIIETAMIAFASLFALIDPVGNAVIFASLTAKNTAKDKRIMAVKGVFIATVILLIFMFVGEPLLNFLGISLAALRISGGILLLLLAIHMVLGKESDKVSASEEKEALRSEDISVFPLATPLIAGAGSISGVILLNANAQGSLLHEATIVLALLALMVITFILLLFASQINKVLGVTGVNVITRIMGVILSALAVQFILDGLSQSGIF